MRSISPLVRAPYMFKTFMTLAIAKSVPPAPARPVPPLDLDAYDA